MQKVYGYVFVAGEAEVGEVRKVGLQQFGSGWGGRAADYFDLEGLESGREEGNALQSHVC